MHFKSKTYFYVYILASVGGTLYVGLTDNLGLRLAQHKDGTYDSFTRRYSVNRLMYVEAFRDSHAAAAREKQNQEVQAGKEDRTIREIKSKLERLEPRLIRSP